MPPRKKGSAPVGRVYKHQEPLQQAKFPARRKTIKTYGSHATRRIPKLAQQETLTQMDFVKMQERELEQEDEDEIEEVEDVEDDEVEIVKPKRKRRKIVVDLVEGHNDEDIVEVVKSSGKRRRTMGDVEEDPEANHEGTKKVAKKSKTKRRKTTGDKPSDGPQYHTQTITQLDWSIISAQKNEEGEALEEEHLPQQDDADTSFDDTIFDIPSSSQALPSSKSIGRKPKQEIVPATSPKPEKNTAAGLMGPPQTPKRILALEIPSSESPATPISPHSIAYGRRSPLRNVSVNTPIAPLNLNPGRKTPGAEYQLPRLEIKDTFDTSTDVSQMTGVPTSPSKKSSPPKSVRFAIPELEPSPTEERSSQRQATQPTQIFSKLEIMDSDAESDGDYMEDALVEVPDNVLAEVEESPPQDTCYGDSGEETQFEVDRILSSSSLSSAPEDSQVEEGISSIAEDRTPMCSPTLTHVDESQIEEDMGDADLDQNQSHFEAKTQFTESQRLHTQHYAVMAPRTINSDVFVSLPSQQVTDIIDRKRDHDVRNWAYPATVSRIWIYVTKPVGALKYMAVISSAKRPGEIEDEAGLGNTLFNKRKANSAWHAYEILELYELADPLPLAKLLDNEWLQEAPKKHMPVRPAVIDSLMANLMPPMFDQFSQEEGDEEEEEGEEDEEGDEVVEAAEVAEVAPSSMNYTQEAEAQLLNTMKQFVQIEPIHLSAGSSQRIPSSQEEMLPPPFVKPVFSNTDILSQATTVDLTQTQAQTQISTPRKPHAPREIILESPTRPVLTSTPARFPTPRSGRSDIYGYDSMVAAPYSLASSQIVSETQMQKDGMFHDSIPVPPAFIQDSDDEDSDEDEL